MSESGFWGLEDCQDWEGRGSGRGEYLNCDFVMGSDWDDGEGDGAEGGGTGFRLGGRNDDWEGEGDGDGGIWSDGRLSYPGFVYLMPLYPPSVSPMSEKLVMATSPSGNSATIFSLPPTASM